MDGMFDWDAFWGFWTGSVKKGETVVFDTKSTRRVETLYVGVGESVRYLENTLFHPIRNQIPPFFYLVFQTSSTPSFYLLSL